MSMNVRHGSTATRRRLRWLIPALLILAWLALGGIGGPFAGKLSEVQTNDNTSFLPASAEATEVAEVQSDFVPGNDIPGIVVAQRADGLTDADVQFLNDTLRSVAGTEGISTEVSPAVPSADGQAAQAFVPIAGDAEVSDAVESIRDALAAAAPDGLAVHVTGPAGLSADLSSAFGGIDGILLIVAATVVLIILVAVYRSPLLPLLVIISAILALGLASLLVYLLADAGAITLNGQSQGILFILVFGAATDYALLLVARFREELRHDTDRMAAMWAAWRATLEPVAASAGTVIAGVLCLMLSDLNSNRSLGPVAALGIAASFLASMTFLPAILVAIGRASFWPAKVRAPRGTDGVNDGDTAARPAEDSDTAARDHRIWSALARRVGAHPRRFWVAATLGLILFSLFVPQFRADGIAESDTFLLDVDSAAGQQILTEHFDAGDGSPALILVDADQTAQIVTAVTIPGVADATPVMGADGAPMVVDGRSAVQATLTDPADSLAAEQTVRDLRGAVREVDPGALVGGPTAVDLDTKETAIRDRNVIIPLVTLVVFAILCLLLRSILAPLLLMGTVILSFAATLGVAALVFNHLLGFPGADPVVPLFAFVFLVALGIDYNIFLMTRAREEAFLIGTRRGVLRALTVTGGVITSAGVVLAATFSALAVIPLIFLAQLAFIVAFGVLLDALIVRTLLVPALVHDVGAKVWWPDRRLMRQKSAGGGARNRSASSVEG